MIDADSRYLGIILDRIRISARYKPKFGQRRKEGLTLQEFQGLYRGDSFYEWFGLDNPMMYAAHKAAGGITSVYRQIGIGCEAVFRQALQDTLGLSNSDAVWSYEIPAPGGRTRRLHLDGRIPLDSVKDNDAKDRIADWMRQSADAVGVERRIFDSLTGVVFEVRQGYKSKDSKRQNADIANASSAYVKSYLPCIVILSNQMDEDVLQRYRSERWVITTGVVGKNDPLVSTYDFMSEVVGYDLHGFFQRNSDALKSEVNQILQALLESGE